MKIVVIEDEKIIFDDGTFVMSQHKQDDWEWHWADFSVLENYNINPKTGDVIDIRDIEFPNDIQKGIKLVRGEGFNLVSSDGAKFFIPCYASNNGYYDTNLKLVIKRRGVGKERIIDIENCQKEASREIQNKKWSE